MTIYEYYDKKMVTIQVLMLLYFLTFIRPKGDFMKCICYSFLKEKQTFNLYLFSLLQLMGLRSSMAKWYLMGWCRTWPLFRKTEIMYVEVFSLVRILCSQLHTVIKGEFKKTYITSRSYKCYFYSIKAYLNHYLFSEPTSVVLGTRSLKKVDDTTMRYNVTRCTHPNYHNVTSGNDIMLLKVSFFFFMKFYLKTWNFRSYNFKPLIVFFLHS